MNNNVEQLRIEVDDIKKSLNDLQNNVDFSEAEKRAKAEDLKNQAEVTKQSIQDIINALENGTDDTSKMEKEKAEALLASFNDITILYNSIINPSINPNVNSNINSNINPSINTGIEMSDQPPTENKSIFTKAKEWIGDQRNSIRDKEKWKSEGGKNLLRTAGALGIGFLAYKGIKKMFGWGKDDEEDNEDYENKETNNENKEEMEEDMEVDKEEIKSNGEESEKKGFRNKLYGKALKWLGISSAAGGGLYKGIENENKKEENKKDENKKEENKKDENKKEENKKEENKKDESKDDESKNDNNQSQNNSQDKIEHSDKKSESADGNVESANGVVEKACQIAVDVANDNSYGYEWGGTGNKNGKKGFDCQGFVRYCYIQTGIKVPPSGGCGTMKRDFEKEGFECITFNKNEKLKPGDILVDPNKHTEMCVAENKIAGAHSNKDKKSGDSGGEEISVRSIKSSLSYRNPKYILRYKGNSA